MFKKINLILSLVLTVAVSFSVIACGDKNKSELYVVKTKFKFMNTALNAQSINLENHPINDIQTLGGSDWKGNALSDLQTFYNEKIGTKIGEGITPSSFILFGPTIYVITQYTSETGKLASEYFADKFGGESYQEGYIDLENVIFISKTYSEDLYDYLDPDFAKPVTFRAGNIPPGKIIGIMLNFQYGLVTFPIPDGIDFKTHANSYYWGEPRLIYRDDELASINGNDVTLPLLRLNPGYINEPTNYQNNNFTDDPWPTNKNPWSTDLKFSRVRAFVFLGNNKIVNKGNLKYNEPEFPDNIVPDSSNTWSDYLIQDYNTDINSISVVLPMQSDSTTLKARDTVYFEIGLDLTGIIERYSGNDINDDSDDIFILKNNFWEGLSCKILAK